MHLIRLREAKLHAFLEVEGFWYLSLERKGTCVDLSISLLRFCRSTPDPKKDLKNAKQKNHYLIES